MSYGDDTISNTIHAELISRTAITCNRLRMMVHPHTSFRALLSMGLNQERTGKHDRVWRIANEYVVSEQLLSSEGVELQTSLSDFAARPPELRLSFLFP